MEKQLDYEALQLKEKLEIQELQNLIGKHLADSSKTEDDLIRLIPNEIGRASCRERVFSSV